MGRPGGNRENPRESLIQRVRIGRFVVHDSASDTCAALILPIWEAIVPIWEAIVPIWEVILSV